MNGNRNAIFWLLTLAVLIWIGFQLKAVSHPAITNLQPLPQQAEAKVAVDSAVFELHEIRNGTTITTGLLNRQTGDLWILSQAKDRTQYLTQVMTLVREDGANAIIVPNKT